NIDENFGRLEAKLKELELDDDTILIFMTDNGTAAGTDGENGYGAGMHGRKGSQYEGGHRVPFFIRWPGVIERGRDVERLTAHIDVIPTLIDLCGLNKPSDVDFDGMSLVPLLAGAGEWPERVIITDSQRVEHPRKWRKSAVMTDRWRLLDGNRLYDIKADPGQQDDIASNHPMVKEKLRQEYDKWWDDISERFGEYCSTIVGSDAEKLTKLTSHDWHADGPWNQGQIRKGQINNGFWAIDVATDGEYEIALRRWPIEADAAVTGALEGGKALNITSARLKTGNFDQTKAIPNKAKQISFRAHLAAGKTRLQTWFTDDKGNTLGAYYVYIRRL
ncbi:MAG: sulfatase-like hydrolase/transferase, partial [Planctomycetota bacterium]